MKSAWDESERQANLAKHRLDFAEAGNVFRGMTFSFEGGWSAYGEGGFITIGMAGDTVVVMAHTEQDGVVRILSMRRATRNEWRLYYRAFAEAWGEE